MTSFEKTLVGEHLIPQCDPFVMGDAEGSIVTWKRTLPLRDRGRG